MWSPLLNIRINKNIIYLRKEVLSYYWVFEGILFGNEYWPLKLKNDDVLLDVGANIGIFTITLHERVNKIICIEPEAQNLELLFTNIKANKVNNVSVIPFAVSNKKQTLLVNDTGGLAKVDISGKPVKAMTIDDVLREYNLPLPTVVKMDIEGSEVKALSGFSNIDQVREIILETHSPELREEVISILMDHNFIVKDVSNPNYKRIIYSILTNILTYFRIERKYEYRTTKKIIKWLFRRGPAPLGTATQVSGTSILYAINQNLSSFEILNKTIV